jgi:hypothetical protein
MPLDARAIASGATARSTVERLGRDSRLGAVDG